MIHDVAYWQSPNFQYYLELFALTNALEAPFYMLVLYKKGWMKALLAILFINLLTHPALIYLSPQLGYAYHLSYRELIIWGELIVPLIEGTALKFLYNDRLSKLIGLAYVANFVSWVFSSWF